MPTLPRAVPCVAEPPSLVADGAAGGAGACKSSALPGYNPPK